MLGFLGPNGAGKSTTMKMIAGFLSPTAGRALVCGHDVVDDPIAAKRVIGYLPEGAPSYGEMNVAPVPRFHRRRARTQRRTQARAARRRDRTPAPERRARAADRNVVEGFQAPRRPRAGDPARSAGADHGRADRRPRSEPETRSAHADQCDGAGQDDHRLHAYARRSARGVQPRDHHRARQDSRRRHAGRTRSALALLPGRFADDGQHRRRARRAVATRRRAGGRNRSAGSPHHRVPETGQADFRGRQRNAARARTSRSANCNWKAVGSTRCSAPCTTQEAA